MEKPDLIISDQLPRPRKGNERKALLALAMVCFFWGTTWIASKEGVRHMPPLQMAGIRQLLGGLCFVVFFILRGAAFPKGKEWNSVLALALLNFVLSNTLSTWGVKYIPAGLGSIIGAIFPLWLILIALLGSNTRVAAQTIAGILLGFAGICVVFYEHLADFLIPEFRVGIFLSFLSTWTWAIGTLYTKKHAARFNPYFSLGLQMLISGAFLCVFALATGNAVPLEQIPWQSWWSIAYLLFFGSIISFVAYLYALQNLPTQQASLYAYMNPIVAILLGYIFFNEKLTVYIIAGTLITLYGVYLVNKEAMKLR